MTRYMETLLAIMREGCVSQALRRESTRKPTSNYIGGVAREGRCLLAYVTETLSGRDELKHRCLYGVTWACSPSVS